MGISSFQRSRFMRATAGLTLTFFLAGCIPGTLKPGGEANGTASTLSDQAGGLLAQVGSVTNILSSASEATGVALPGAKKGYDHRTWTQDDQAAAERAVAAFSGKPLDDLAVFNPTTPGETEKYNAKLKELVAKYKDRAQLTPAETLELAEVVLPMMRYLAKSEAYRASQKTKTKVVRHAKGNDTVVIPAFSTVEMAALTYCNDHGLPAPWRGEKLSMRPLADYIPNQLQELYTDLHKYAATNPAAHYKMQSLVWALRDNPCAANGLSDAHQALIEAAHKGGVLELQKYCMTKKIKDQALASAQGMIPGASQLATAQQYINQAQDYQAKADAFLKADLSDPAELLKLAQTTGLQPNFGRSPLLDNPYLKQALPLLKQSGLAGALTPTGTDDKAVATTLSVMEELGRAIGESAGEDQGSIADYSDLGNGMYAKVYTPGGASNAKIDVINTTGRDQIIRNSDFVLSSVDDPATGRTNYRATQRLSIGPLQPISYRDNDPNAGKQFTPQNEAAVKKALDPLKEMKAGIGETASAAEQDKIDCPTGNIRWGDVGRVVTSEIVKTIPFIGNLFNGYIAITGYDPISGEKLDAAEQLMAGLSAAVPFGALAGKLYGGLRLGLGARSFANGKAAFGAADDMTNVINAGLQGQQAYFEFDAGNECKGWKNLAATASGLVCAKARKPDCTAATAITSSVGAAQYKREVTEADKLFIDLETVNTGGVAGIGQSVSDGVNAVKSWFN